MSAYNGRRSPHSSPTQERQADLVDLLTDKHVKARQHLHYDPDFFGDRNTVEQQVLNRKTYGIACKSHPFHADFLSNPGEDEPEKRHAPRRTQFTAESPPRVAQGVGSERPGKTYLQPPGGKSVINEEPSAPRMHRRVVQGRPADHDFVIEGGNSLSDRLSFTTLRTFQPRPTDPLSVNPDNNFRGSAMVTRSASMVFEPQLPTQGTLSRSESQPTFGNRSQREGKRVYASLSGGVQSSPPQMSSGKRTYNQPQSMIYESGPFSPAAGKKSPIWLSPGSDSDFVRPADIVNAPRN